MAVHIVDKNGQFICFLHGFIAAAYRYRWQHVLVGGFISLHSKGNPINGRLNQLTTDLEEINQHLSEKNLIPVASFDSFDFLKIFSTMYMLSLTLQMIENSNVN